MLQNYNLLIRSYNYFLNFYLFYYQLQTYIIKSGRLDICYYFFLKSFNILFNRCNGINLVFTYFNYEYILQLILCSLQNIGRLTLKFNSYYQYGRAKVKYNYLITLISFLEIRIFNALNFIYILIKYTFNNILECLFYNIFNFIFNIDKSLLLLRTTYNWQYIVSKLKFYWIIQYSIYLNYYFNQLSI